jgi:hypothetical protein
MIKTALLSNADSYHMDNLEARSMLDRWCEEEERLEGWLFQKYDGQVWYHLVQVGLLASYWKLMVQIMVYIFKVSTISKSL